MPAGRRTKGRSSMAQQKSEDRVVTEVGVMAAERAGSSPGGQGKAVLVEETKRRCSSACRSRQQKTRKGLPAGGPGTSLGRSGRERRRRSTRPGRQRRRRWSARSASPTYESDPGAESRGARACDGVRRVEGVERLSGCARRSSTSPRGGEITTERRPAATSPAALASLTTPSWSPISLAATMTVREVA